ncbi:MAG: hypothetical protein JXM69_17900 [Anaerolineae bacterium]|nr:hypothetical protein [Anaerolineae bacterium]
MMRQLTHQTTLTMYLIVKDDTGGLAFSIRLITKFFAFISRLNQVVSRLRYEWVMLRRDVQVAVIFTGKVLQIGLFSMAYGLGVKL